MRPKPIPSLTEEQFEVLVKETQRKPSKADFQRLERLKLIKEIIENSPIQS